MQKLQILTTYLTTSGSKTEKIYGNNGPKAKKNAPKTPAERAKKRHSQQKEVVKYFWEQDATGSNPVTPTKKRPFLRLKTFKNGFFVILHTCVLNPKSLRIKITSFLFYRIIIPFLLRFLNALFVALNGCRVCAVFIRSLSHLREWNTQIQWK
ncbi:MAG: hypothetical protein IJW78_00490 [Clostridia bacterium]|nr:hypothetical protein [Clostridia bacterium]